MRLGFLLASWLCIVPYTFCMAGRFLDKRPAIKYSAAFQQYFQV